MKKTKLNPKSDRIKSKNLSQMQKLALEVTEIKNFATMNFLKPMIERINLMIFHRRGCTFL